MPEVLQKTYDPRRVEPEIYAHWEASGAFRSTPDGSSHDLTFTIVIPPPNVTGALHLGHALNNTLQDILIRYHRMRGFNTLWQPGTDHAGIATQAVVERRIREQEGKNRHELGREELVNRIWQWKVDYEKRIIGQLKLMGCSCDWERTRFTLDEGLARAVRHIFFKLFKDGLIFRGKRLVNWDTQLQTAVADDEVYHETVKGYFWHFKYPVIDPKPGEPHYVVIATTRPETMLGDTAVAVHPDPEAFFEEEEAKAREIVEKGSAKERPVAQARIEVLAQRRDSHLPDLIKLRDMAVDGRKLRLPLIEREIPLITDEWADPSLGSGCVKITPAHDPNDYEVGLRNELTMINVLTPDGKIAPIIEPNPSAAPCKEGTSENQYSERYAGLPFSTEGRDRVVDDMEQRGLLKEVEVHQREVGHSDRSKVPIEPYLSDQWFVRTSAPEKSDAAVKDGLAQTAMDAVQDGRIQVFPGRYAKSYLDWLGEKRDWCISRQLWWGHRIPVWTTRCTYNEWLKWGDGDANAQNASCLLGDASKGSVYVRAENSSGETFMVAGGDNAYENVAMLRDAVEDDRIQKDEPLTWYVTVDEGFKGYDQQHRKFDSYEAWLEETGLSQDPDVLDTWFSSALWPFSTLGWPEVTEHLKQYYPGSVLCTSRDIITNWVARMVMFGRYAMGRIPFDHVYIHPKILDGRGETMSKSKGNGVDPVDIIHTQGADAMRYTLADMTTETQDIRMPVEYVCPHCSHLTDQSIALKNEEQARKSRGQKLDRKLQPADCLQIQCSNKECGKSFATQWSDADVKEQLGLGRETSDKFEIGRNFCNKLWNAARFAFMNLDGAPCEPLSISAFYPEDRWILARLSFTIRRYHETMREYQFAASVKELRDFFWDSLCDWYLELTKPRLGESATKGDPAKQILAFCIDQVLRLWHPTIPFITERLWQQLNDIAPKRGFPGIAKLETDGDLIRAEFPPVEGYPVFDDEGVLATFASLQDAVRGVRELRNTSNVPPKDRVKVTIVMPADRIDAFNQQSHIVKHMAGIGELEVVSSGTRPKNAGSVTIGSTRIFVHDISDDEAERERTTKALEGVEKQIAGKESKLSNEKFVANAKPEIVQAERDRLQDLLAERESLQAHLADLAE